MSIVNAIRHAEYSGFFPFLLYPLPASFTGAGAVKSNVDLGLSAIQCSLAGAVDWFWNTKQWKFSGAFAFAVPGGSDSANGGSTYTIDTPPAGRAGYPSQNSMTPAQFAGFGGVGGLGTGGGIEGYFVWDYDGSPQAEFPAVISWLNAGGYNLNSGLAGLTPFSIDLTEGRVFSDPSDPTKVWILQSLKLGGSFLFQGGMGDAAASFYSNPASDPALPSNYTASAGTMSFVVKSPLETLTIPIYFYFDPSEFTSCAVSGNITLEQLSTFA